MRIVLPLLLSLTGSVFAQDAVPPPDLPTAGPATATGTVLLDDRDASATPVALQDEPTPPRADAPLPEKILEPPPPEAAPTVSIRSDGDDVVEEYRQNGKLYMVKVRPPRGVPYTLLDSNGDGRLDAHDSDAPVAPVYYTLYEWN
jgi:hypothetical protein